MPLSIRSDMCGGTVALTAVGKYIFYLFKLCMLHTSKFKWPSLRVLAGLSIDAQLRMCEDDAGRVDSPAGLACAKICSALVDPR